MSDLPEAIDNENFIVFKKYQRFGTAVLFLAMLFCSSI